MNTFDRLLGRQPESHSPRRATAARPIGFAESTSFSGQPTDEQAIERYRYLLRTAPPAAIEQAHAEAFTQLTPEQRRLVLEGLSRDLPAQEQTDRDDPQSLARLATRAELRRPGTLERTFGGMNAGGTGIGLGGFLAADFLSTVAGFVIGSAIADALFSDGGPEPGDAGGNAAAGADQGADAAGAGSAGGDPEFDAVGGLDGGDFGGGEL